MIICNPLNDYLNDYLCPRAGCVGRSVQSVQRGGLDVERVPSSTRGRRQPPEFVPVGPLVGCGRT